MKKCIIIFSGFNQRAVIAFLRTLEFLNIDYVIIAKSNDDTIFLTDYKEKVYSIRSSVPLELEDLIKSINIVKGKKKYDEFIIAPSTEALNRFLLQYRSKFEQLGCTIPLVEKELYEQISDKYSFGELCKNNDIIIPKEYDNFNKIDIPFVAKPKKYISQNGKIHSPFLILNKNDKLNFIKTCQHSDFYFQEFINGKSLYLLYYFHRNGKVYKFSQQNLIQQPNGKSIVAAVSSNFHLTQESKKYEKLFQNIGFYGLVMVEVKQNRNKNYMIEANPRFWGPSQLFVDAKMNFFETFLHDFGLLKHTPIFHEISTKHQYFWFGGVLEAFKQKKELTYHQGNETDLLNELPFYLKSDIYRKKDTFELFKNELT